MHYLTNALLYQRTELSGLARNTISKCETIVTKFEEMVAGNRGLDSDMKNILRKMRTLLNFSEEKLKEVKDTMKRMLLKDAKELKVINEWANSAELVSKNIDEYSEEYLRKYETIRTVFKIGLDDLKSVAQKFLKQPTYIV